MHNAGPLLFLCIVRFYARSDVSHSMTIRDLCQKCHASNMISIFMGEKLLPKKELRVVCLIEFAWIVQPVPIFRSPFSQAQKLMPFLVCKSYRLCLGSQSVNLNKGLHIIYPKWMEKCWNFGLLHLRSIFWHKGHIRVDTDPKKIQVQWESVRWACKYPGNP